MMVLRRAALALSMLVLLGTAAGGIGPVIGKGGDLSHKAHWKTLQTTDRTLSVKEGRVAGHISVAARAAPLPVMDPPSTSPAAAPPSTSPAPVESPSAPPPTRAADAAATALPPQPQQLGNAPMAHSDDQQTANTRPPPPGHSASPTGDQSPAGKTLPLASSSPSPAPLAQAPPPAKPRGPTAVLIAVETAPEHFNAREAIRATWGATLNPEGREYDAAIAADIDLRFFVGELSGPATAATHDIDTRISHEPSMVRLSGFEENYSNLSSKTLGIICWAVDNGYDHVLKVDDDVFLQLDNLHSFVRSFGGGRLRGAANVYGGEFTYDAWVQRDPHSKWYISREDYPDDQYPPYAFGPCYFVGSALAQAIASSRQTLRMLQVEDAGLSIWLRTMLPDSMIQHEQMENMWYQAECYNQAAVFITPVSARELHMLHQNRARYGDLCGSWQDPFVPQECVIRRCHCYPIPEGDDCQEAMGKESFIDFIPRLLQYQKATFMP